MTKQIALKIDVDTYRGTRDGVPRLADALKRHGAQATFFFSLGPDHTGRAIKRVFRPGFMKKVSRTSVVEHYGIRTLLYGTVLPGSNIGRRCGVIMRGVREAGFEVGIHCDDHIRWQDYVAGKDADWTRRELQRAVNAFRGIFGEVPENLRKEMKLHFVDSMDEVLQIALEHPLPGGDEGRAIAPPIPPLSLQLQRQFRRLILLRACRVSFCL